MQSPSFLAHQRTLESLHGRSNLQTLFHNIRIPTDNHIRKMLDGVPTDHFDQAFFYLVSDLQSSDILKKFKVLDDNVLIALDGSEYFSSYKIKCPNCSTRTHHNGETEYFHSFLGAVLVRPGQSVALPLPPEFVTPQDGGKKQDCEQRASARWLDKHMPRVKALKLVFLGDDLYAHQPFCEKILANEASFIIEELLNCARARWKIENETFNVLKNNGYNLEHNFGHGQKTLAVLLVVFNLLAFAIHSACRLTEHLWIAGKPEGLVRYFPGSGEGGRYAAIQLKRQLTFTKWIEGRGDLRNLQPGHSFSVYGHIMMATHPLTGINYPVRN